MNPDKKRIQRRFSRSASTYNRQAVIQYQVADTLMTLLDRHLVLSPSRILEIGCCTGLLTHCLVDRFQGHVTLFVNDLVPDFEPTVLDGVGQSAQCTFVAGDIESIAIPDDLDLIISSSTFHWIEDFPALLKKLHAHMAPEGTLAFSMYSTENLKEMREITGIGLHYFSLDELVREVSRYFTLEASYEEQVTFNFANPRAVLDHLRQTGVNALDGTTWTRSRLHGFIDEYARRFSDRNQVLLTYHPAYIVARKKK